MRDPPQPRRSEASVNRRVVGSSPTRGARTMCRGGRIGRGLLVVLACCAAAPVTAASSRAETGFFFAFANEGQTRHGSLVGHPRRGLGARAVRLRMRLHAA